jgi:hypothetical protein
MTQWLFKTPTVEEGPAGQARLFHFYKIDRGITIVRELDGDYAQVRYLQDEQYATYPEIYQGGYNHVVDDATKARLIAGGIGVTESNFTAL